MAKRVWLKGHTFIVIFMIRMKTMVILRDYPIRRKKGHRTNLQFHLSVNRNKNSKLRNNINIFTCSDQIYSKKVDPISYKFAYEINCFGKFHFIITVLFLYT